MNGFYLIKKFSDRIYWICRILFIVVFCQFPEETAKTQSPSAKRANIALLLIIVGYRFVSTSKLPGNIFILFPLKADCVGSLSSGK
jgi:hypothetical protein